MSTTSFPRYSSFPSKIIMQLKWNSDSGQNDYVACSPQHSWSLSDFKTINILWLLFCAEVEKFMLAQLSAFLEKFSSDRKNSSNAALSEQSCFPSYRKQRRVISQLQNFQVFRGKILTVMERLFIAPGEFCHNSQKRSTEGTARPQLTCFF